MFKDKLILNAVINRDVEKVKLPSSLCKCYTCFFHKVKDNVEQIVKKNQKNSFYSLLLNYPTWIEREICIGVTAARAVLSGVGWVKLAASASPAEAVFGRIARLCRDVPF